MKSIWEIKPNGADVIATNNSTGEVFSGTRDQLNVKLASVHQDSYSRTLVHSDATRQLSSDASTAVTYTIPLESEFNSLQAGSTLTAYQAGTGTVSFIAGPGVTLVGVATSSGRYQSVEVQRIGVNNWAVVNKVTAATDSLTGAVTGLVGPVGPGGVRMAIPYSLLQTAVPICIPPGNGSTVGLQFTNTAGAFSLTTSTFTNTYSAGIWMYMPVGAFDGTLPLVAGFYWAIMSSGSVGQMYGVTYQSTIPVTTPAIVTTSARWLTQVTTAVVLVQASLPANALGKNGSLNYRHIWSVSNSAGTKTLNLLLDTGVNITSLSPTTNGGWNGLASVTNRGVANRQISAGQGVGGQGFTSMTGAAALYSVDTSAPIAPGAAGQLAANTDYIILESVSIQVCPL